MNPQCARCGKVVYPTEKVNCLDKVRRRRAGEPGARRRGAWRQVARTVPGAAALRPLRRSSAQGGRRSPYRRADAGLAPSRAAAAAGTRRGKRALWGGRGEPATAAARDASRGQKLPARSVRWAGGVFPESRLRQPLTQRCLGGAGSSVPGCGSSDLSPGPAVSASQIDNAPGCGTAPRHRPWEGKAVGGKRRLVH